MNSLNIPWTDFKTFVNANSASVQYFLLNNYYYLFAFNGIFSVNCYIPLSDTADVLDFELNYKPSGNASLANLGISQIVGSVAPGTAAIKSVLTGGQYNSSPLVLTNGQQAATQVDSSGKLLTTTTISSVATTVAPSYSNKIKSLPQLSVIAIPSSVSYTTIFTYSGSGYFVGFNLEFNNTAIVVKLEIDGNIVLDDVDIGTYNGLAVTSNATTRYQAGQGVITSSSVFDFSFKYPIVYTSSVTISARLTSGSTSRNFQKGIVYIQKDT